MRNGDLVIETMIFEGNPNGLIMCDLESCRAYKVSRNELQLFSRRDDSMYACVYFLFGKDINNSNTIYIGESDNAYERLKTHTRNDEAVGDWNDCIIVISNNKTLNKAHVRYLEKQFFSLAKESGRTIVNNRNIPSGSSHLSEYDIAKLESFIGYARLLVSILGYKVFDSVEETAVSINNDRIIFSISATRGANAKGIIVSDGFAVLKGSKVADTVVGSMLDGYARLRKSLFERGIINEQNELVQDYVFTSSSPAASVVMGRTANGRTEWKTENAETLKEYEENNNLL